MFYFYIKLLLYWDKWYDAYILFNCVQFSSCELLLNPFLLVRTFCPGECSVVAFETTDPAVGFQEGKLIRRISQ